MRPYLNAYPIQNGPELGAGLAQFNASYSNPSSLDAYSVRVDHDVNSKLRIFGRYNYSPSSIDQRCPSRWNPVPEHGDPAVFHRPCKPAPSGSPN